MATCLLQPSHIAECVISTCSICLSAWQLRGLNDWRQFGHLLSASDKSDSRHFLQYLQPRDISIPQQKTMKQKGQDYLVEQKCSLFSHQWHIEHAFIVAVHCSDMEMLPDVLYRLLYSTWYSHIVCKSQLGSVTYRISKCTV